MAYFTNVRERVHQPVRDSLIRTAGTQLVNIPQQTLLFSGNTNGLAKTAANSNLDGNSGALQSDQSIVVLVLRVFFWYRRSVPRTVGLDGTINFNGDFLSTNYTPNTASAPGNAQDLLRLYHQSIEQLYWTFGFGIKPSLISMPTSYFPWGGGLTGDFGGNTDLVWGQNGTADQSGIARLGRAIAGPPRQLIKCVADIIPMEALGGGGNAQQPIVSTSFSQGSRNMLDLADNLGAADLINKSVGFAFDGLLSREVQ